MATMRRSFAAVLAFVVVCAMLFIMSSPTVTGRQPATTPRTGTVGLGRRVEREAREALSEAEEVAADDPLAFAVEVRSATHRNNDGDGDGEAEGTAGKGGVGLATPMPETRMPEKEGEVYYQRIIPTAEDDAVTAANEAAIAKGGAHYFAWLANTPQMPIAPWKPGRARPIVCEGHGEYYSGHFSIPPENMMPETQLAAQLAAGERTRDWSTVIPYAKNTYVFKEEADYRRDMEISRFGATRRKLGFATMRNLELLAAGTIPYFCSADRIPRTGTLASLPLGFFRAVVQWPGVYMRCDPKKKTRVYPIARPPFNETQYGIAATKLLAWTHLYQRTDYHALYVLSATSLTALPKNVLVLWASHYTILLTTIIHGLAELGVSVTDVPRRADTYRGEACEKGKHETYAKGWFFFCKAKESEGISRDNIEARIAAKEFDLIIISVTDTLTYHMKDPHTDIPFFGAITAAYPRDRVLTINDADLIRPMQHDVAHKFMHNMSLYFKRETHGCNEDIMYKKM